MSFDPQSRMTNLKGKEYLEVKWRAYWFREEHPDWSIITDLLEVSPQQALFKATIMNDKGSIISVSHGSETPKDFGDYIEKAETKAIGRALAYAGYGTQFAPDLEEGQRIVDSPVQRTTTAPPTYQHKAAPTQAASVEVVDITGGDKPSEEVLNYIPFKNGLDAGKPMKDISTSKLEWLINSDKTGAATKAKAQAVLAWKKGSKGESVPMPTDADAPDEKLENEEPPW